MKNIFRLICLVAVQQLHSQCIAPFSKINNSTYLFDDGQTHFIEALPVKSMQVGRNNIAGYIAQSGSLKAYYNGEVHTLDANSPDWHVTDNWMVYQNFNEVKVLSDTGFITLETQFRPGIDTFFYSDSVIVWTNTQSELKVYYNGQTQIIDRLKARMGKAADNLFAFVDYLGLFKVFYHGELHTLETYQPVLAGINRDMVVYIDQYDNIKFFQEGELHETNSPMYSLFVTGEGFAAYLTNLNKLAVYYKGEETILLEDKPDTLMIKENLLAYTDKGNNFWCWYKGQKYWLERYKPLSFKIDNDILVYQDLNGRLKAFYYGEEVQVSDQIVKDYSLYNETVTYSLQPYQTKVWCNKKTYSFE